ncbi:putative cyclic nucleotide-gated ion channel 16 [Turnera subulata]|uniref:Cyclic nucleotide-gated ion channel 16 n=1 Tax=Turnera subulata TaxID=218843 RepID=A0A9Q0J0I5_9ROSI|nr:putative cyclic nucleotide-gated ion channel 16 [Turnera subulata]KAJ4845384.1 putative cyclic nucleotide-gated ion channel 16 [Turnera subulata]
MNSLNHYASARFRRHHIPKSFSLRRQVPWWHQILEPGSPIVNKWNHIFLITCIIALFLDPLYFYLPVIGGEACMSIDLALGVWVTLARTVTDLCFIFHVVIKFRTAFVSPSSRVFGRGELVRDPRAIAMRYLKSDFIIDVLAALPLPQIVIWFIIPAVKNPTADHANHTLSLIVLFQYIPRFLVLFPLNRRIVKTTGVVATTAWSGAAYNLLLYVLASHILGATWYLAAIQRQHECWEIQCSLEKKNRTKLLACDHMFLDCSSRHDPDRMAWLQTTELLANCDAKNDLFFHFGLFADAFTNDVASASFIDKFFYCLWWGLRNLSSYGQNLIASTFVYEMLFSIGICIMGLVLFAHLIGNMQTYMQSASARIDEWRIRRRDTEEWMRHRQLPPELQERVRRFVQYKWLATKGVDEESILRALPLDIRRQIQRHLCLALVRRVPFFAQMDDQLLDAICERLVSSLNTKDTYIVREGDPVNEMLFIIRGQLESSTTNGGRTGFFNSITLRAGDFCGEELLTWALDTTSNLMNLPLSTRTVRALSEVEAFALRAEDLKFVAKQFKRLHSKKLQHAFRYYSHHWRTWGSCYIQAAWRRHMRRKLQWELERQENMYYSQFLGGEDEYYNNAGDGGASSHSGQHLGATILASKFAKNTRKPGVTRKLADDDTLKMPKLFKPQEPNFDDDG